MASPVLYCEDLAAGKYATGSASVTGIDATDATSKEAYLSDVNQCTQWAPGAGTWDVKYNLGSTDGAKAVAAIGFGNCEGLSGLTVTVYRAATFGATTTTFASFTAPNLKNFVVTGSAGTNQFWMVRIASATSATKIGTISILSSAGAITLTGRDAPRWPINRPLRGGRVSIRTAAGRVTVGVGAPTMALGLTFEGPQVSSGGTWDTMESAFATYNAFENGVWFTDDAFSSPGRGYYGTVDDGIQGAASGANAEVRGGFTIETLPEGIKVS